MKIKIGLIFILYLLIAFRLTAGNSDTTNILSKAREAMLLQHQFPDSSLKLAKEMLKESEVMDYKRGVAYAVLRIGSILNMKGENSAALGYIKRAIQIRKELNDFAGASSASSVLAWVYAETGNVDSAFVAFYNAVRFVEHTKDSALIGETYLDLANFLCDYNELKESKLYYDKAHSLSLRTDDKLMLANSLGGYGKYFMKLQESETALFYYLKSAHLFDSLEQYFYLSNVYTNIGVCYASLKRFDLAIYFYKNSLKHYIELGYVEDILLSYYNIGLCFFKRETPDSAIFYLQKSKEIALANDYLVRTKDSYESLAMAYKQKGDFRQAYHYNKEYSILKDSLLNSEKVSRIAEMQTKYETEKKEQQITLLNEQNKTKEAQRNFLIAAASVLVLIVFTLTFFFIQRKKLAHKNELIAKQKIESLLDEQEIKTNNAMLKGQEEERMRIATDLHDRLGSMLSTVKLLFSSLDEKIDKAQEENKKQYEKANDLLDEACVEVRRISHNLGAGMVAGFGLIKALEELCESIDQSGKISCDFSIYGDVEDRLTLNVEIGIYRIVQEVFNNALKYSRAKNLNLQINKLNEEKLISIMVEDDGVGFDPEEARKKGGLGLKSMKNRVEKLGGTLHIDSSEGRGVTTVVEIPLNMEA